MMEKLQEMQRVIFKLNFGDPKNANEKLKELSKQHPGTHEVELKSNDELALPLVGSCTGHLRGAEIWIEGPSDMALELAVETGQKAYAITEA